MGRHPNIKAVHIYSSAHTKLMTTTVPVHGLWDETYFLSIIEQDLFYHCSLVLGNLFLFLFLYFFEEHHEIKDNHCIGKSIVVNCNNHCLYIYVCICCIKMGIICHTPHIFKISSITKNWKLLCNVSLNDNNRLLLMCVQNV